MTGREMKEWRGWDAIAQALHHLAGIPIASARNRVILRGLRMGDARPFYYWVRNENHRPSQEVVLHLARMVAKAEAGPGFLSLKEEIDTPYGLSVSHRARGNQFDIEVEARNYFTAREVARLKANGDGYDSAIAAVRDWLSSVHGRVSEHTVRAAYDGFLEVAATDQLKGRGPKKKTKMKRE